MVVSAMHWNWRELLLQRTGLLYSIEKDGEEEIFVGS
jgi:hypothetical protein